MNKTQKELISRLVNRYDRGSYKQGWTATFTAQGNYFLTLQKLNEINQAFRLAEMYPDIFTAESKSFRCVNLFILNQEKARLL